MGAATVRRLLCLSVLSSAMQTKSRATSPPAKKCDNCPTKTPKYLIGLWSVGRSDSFDARNKNILPRRQISCKQTTNKKAANSLKCRVGHLTKRKRKNKRKVGKTLWAIFIPSTHPTCPHHPTHSPSAVVMEQDPAPPRKRIRTAPDRLQPSEPKPEYDLDALCRTLLVPDTMSEHAVCDPPVRLSPTARGHFFSLTVPSLPPPIPRPL